jgi:hypothetical protein
VKYGELNLGQIEAIVNGLGGMDGVRRFLSGELVVKLVDRNWSIWKTIKLGTGIKDADDFRKAIKDCGMQIGDWANDILCKPQFTVATEETEVDLVIVSVAELGFKNRAKLKDIFTRAKELGLQLCPNEVGPQLRLQYPDQSKNEWLIIGMEPVADSVGYLRLFSVAHGGGGLWLGAYYDYPDSVWISSNRFVFVLPRK